MIAPVPVQDVHAGRAAFDRDLAAALRGQSLNDRGWGKPDDLTLLIPLFAVAPNLSVDFYLLKLFFDHYPKGPPSAQFVNPATLGYTHPADAKWVPRIEGHASIAFHTNYNGIQLICSSTTLEFYKVNHDVKEQHIWQEGRMTFMSTLAAVRSGLAQPFYKGRAA